MVCVIGEADIFKIFFIRVKKNAIRVEEKPSSVRENTAMRMGK